MVAFAALGAGCDQGTTSLSASGDGPAPTVLWTSPAAEATGVGLHQSIRVQFDRFLLPSVTTRQAICVRAGSPTNTPVPCVSDVVLQPEYDPVDRVIAWRPMDPGFMPQTRYTVQLIRPQSDSDLNGIRAFDDVALAAKPFPGNVDSFAFTTGDASSQPTLPEPNRSVDYCYTPDSVCPLPNDVCTLPTPTPLFGYKSGPNGVMVSCGGAGVTGCHGAPLAPAFVPKGQAGSALILNAGTDNTGIPVAIQQLVTQSVVATQTATGASPRTPERTASTPFGQNMPYIDSGNPGNSYLLYKTIIGDRLATFDADYYNCAVLDGGLLPGAGTNACTSKDPFTATPAKVGTTGQTLPSAVDPWVPLAQSAPASPEEVGRLRQRIRGQPMPQGGFVPHTDAETLSAWIASGAPASVCP